MTPTPAKDPRVEIGGQSYTLKYGPTAEFIAGNLGVDIPLFLRSMADRTPKAFSNFLNLFSAMVAHHFIRLKQTPPAPEQWAIVLEDLSEDDRAAKIAEIAEAVMAVILPKLKASAATVRLQEPTPKTELPPLN